MKVRIPFFAPYALLISGEVEVIDGINPNDPVQDFSLRAHKFKHDTLIVGHLPFMANLVSYLVTGNEDQVIVAYIVPPLN